MKNIKPSYVERIIIDAGQDPEITKGNPIVYSTEEIEYWIEHGLLPKKLMNVGRKWIKEFDNRSKFMKKNPNATDQEYKEWLNSKSKKKFCSNLKQLGKRFSLHFHISG